MISWMPLLAGRLNSATDGGIHLTEGGTVDPLKKQIRAKLRHPIPGREAWIAFQIICHAFAAANNAAIHSIRKISDNLYVLDILIRSRLASTTFDPFIDDWTSNRQKRREEYMRYLKEKRKEIEEELNNEAEPTSKLPPDPSMWNR